uniref:Putative secreted protein n=1 Tax=Anopheles darlingi TaxID=43151 RepID=A0A2M4D9R9_ANODA
MVVLLSHSCCQRVCVIWIEIWQMVYSLPLYFSNALVEQQVDRTQEMERKTINIYDTTRLLLVLLFLGEAFSEMIRRKEGRNYMLVSFGSGVGTKPQTFTNGCSCD